MLGRLFDFVSDGWPEENSSADQWHAFRLRKDELSIEDGCVLWGNRVIIPTSLQTLVLKELHVSHPGICRMKALARSYVCWPNRDRVIAESVKECKPCKEHQNMPAKAPLHPLENITQPWTRLHIDFAGPFLGRVFLIVVDAYSKWIEAFPLSPNNYGSKVTIDCLRSAFATHGLPQLDVSDNGTSFTSTEFQSFMKNNGIRHVTSAPYHPSTNGHAERAVQSFKNALKKMDSTPSGDSITRLNRFLFAYRTTPKTTTEMSPAELLMNRKVTTRLSLIKPSIQKRMAKQGTYEERPPPRSFSTGDWVWMRNYSKIGSKWIQGRIEAKLGPLFYHVQADGKIHQ